MQIYWNIRKEFNSHRIGLGHQHGRHFIILGHQYGRCDIIFTHSIGICSVYIGDSDENFFQIFFTEKKNLKRSASLPGMSNNVSAVIVGMMIRAVATRM